MSEESGTIVAFGDVVELHKERTSDADADGFERYVGLEHLDPGSLSIRRWGSVADGTSFTNIFRPGHVLFAKRRAYQGKVALADFSGVCSGDIYVLKPKDDRLLAGLLAHICQTDAFYNHAIGTSAGSLSPRTNWIHLSEFEFVMPALERQQRVLDILSSAVLTEQRSRGVVNSIEVVARSAREAFFRGIGNRPTELGDLLDSIVAGRSLVGVNRAPSPDEKAVLKVSAVAPSGFRPLESKALVDQDSFLPEYAIQAGDLLVTRANTRELVGLTSLIESNYPHLMASDKTLKLVPSEGVSTMVLFHALQTVEVRQQMMSRATGTGSAMKNLSQAKLRQLRVRYPTSDRETAEFEHQMAGIVRGRRAAEAYHHRLADLRELLTNDLLGQWR